MCTGLRLENVTQSDEMPSAAKYSMPCTHLYTLKANIGPLRFVRMYQGSATCCLAEVSDKKMDIVQGDQNEENPSV